MKEPEPDSGAPLCLACLDAGAKPERIYGGMGSSTSMAVEMFWDSNGRYHHHDPNVHREHFRCSNGHDFYRTRTKDCWCGK